jgi:hypothetical protein
VIRASLRLFAVFLLLEGLVSPTMATLKPVRPAPANVSVYRSEALVPAFGWAWRPLTWVGTKLRRIAGQAREQTVVEKAAYFRALDVEGRNARAEFIPYLDRAGDFLFAGMARRPPESQKKLEGALRSWEEFQLFWSALSGEPVGRITRLADDPTARPGFYYLLFEHDGQHSFWRIRTRRDAVSPQLRVDHLEREQPRNAFQWQGEYRIGFAIWNPESEEDSQQMHLDVLWRHREKQLKNVNMIPPFTTEEFLTGENQRQNFKRFMIDSLLDEFDQMKIVNAPAPPTMGQELGRQLRSTIMAVLMVVMLESAWEQRRSVPELLSMVNIHAARVHRRTIPTKSARKSPPPDRPVFATLALLVSERVVAMTSLKTGPTTQPAKKRLPSRRSALTAA